jgi:glycosyltransferase involved in cell wall biosynthesis
VPCFNEAANIRHFYQAISTIFDQQHDLAWEVIFIDDGSHDETLAILSQMQVEHRNIVILELSRNFGKEAAMTAGLDVAQGDAVIPIDVDLQDPPEVITTMIAAWQAGAEVVLAKRVDRSSDHFLKRTSASYFYRFHNTLSKIKIPENVGDFRLMDKVVVEAIRQLPERQRFMKGLFAWVGFRTVTVEYTRNKRHAGDSKFSGLALWNFALEGMTSFSTAPLKIWTYLGSIVAILTFFYALFILFYAIFHGTHVPGYASLLVAILFFGSVQLISVGLLGEYIGRIYFEAKQRPNYIIRKIHGAKNGS